MERAERKKSRITPEMRRDIHKSQDGITAAAKRFGVHPNAIRRWRARENVNDLPRHGHKSRLEFVQDLEALFAMALGAGNYSAALRAKEILGKEAGFFAKKERAFYQDPTFEALTKENLEQLLEALMEKSRRVISKEMEQLGKGQEAGSAGLVRGGG